jgi:1-acyl-sn-glycerol-3-phosphate acyltransferase
MMGRIRIIRFLAMIVPVTLLLIPLQWLMVTFWPSRAGVIPHYFHRLTAQQLGLKIRRFGRPYHGRPLLFMSNHMSWLDIVALSTVMPISFVARADMAGWPIFGLFAKLQRSIFVERTRKSATKAANSALTDRLLAGDPVVLFAEGTTSDGNRVLPFRSSMVGAVEAIFGQAEPVVQPVALAYTRYQGLPMLRSKRPDVAWYGDMDLIPHFAGILKGGPIEVTLTFCDPLSLEDMGDRKQLTKAAETVIRRAASRANRGLMPI